MNCQTCRGACCESFELPVSDVIVPGDALQNDINDWLRLHATQNGDRLVFECACTKLTEEGSCGIYDSRPMVCRVYEAGGAWCLAAVKERRTAEQYQAIRDEDDPEAIHE